MEQMLEMWLAMDQSLWKPFFFFLYFPTSSNLPLFPYTTIIRISFKHAEHVNHFRTCLLISTEEYEERGNDYDVKDFAILSSDFSSMTPLGLGGSGGDGKGRVEVEEVDLFTYWCAEIRGEDLKRAEGNEITLFPIVRMDGYEDEEVFCRFFYEKYFFSSHSTTLLFTGQFSVSSH